MPEYLPFDLFADLEARQEELIKQLDHLNDQIEAVLSEYVSAPRIELDETLPNRKAS